MKINIKLENKINKMFGSQQVCSMFNIDNKKNIKLYYNVEVPNLNDDWQIGLIVGHSGSGKTNLIKHAFKNYIIDDHKWDKNKSVIDDFDTSISVKDIIIPAFTAVGFSSPPSWLIPYHYLSMGEKHRCDLAKSLITNDVVIYDEFTSTVDRTVAKTMSLAISKSIKKDIFKCKKFIAVTCHHDIVDWLCPDWYINLDNPDSINNGENNISDFSPIWTRGKLQRPKIKIEIRRGRKKSWANFARYHYLSGAHHNAADIYEAYVSMGKDNKKQAGFISIIQAPGFKLRKRVHRLVVLPDFQGIGVGGILLDTVCNIITNNGYKTSIVTSHPSLINRLFKSELWTCINIKRDGFKHNNRGKIKKLSQTESKGRPVTSFLYTGKI